MTHKRTFFTFAALCAVPLAHGASFFDDFSGLGQNPSPEAQGQNLNGYNGWSSPSGTSSDPLGNGYTINASNAAMLGVAFDVPLGSSFSATRGLSTPLAGSILLTNFVIVDSEPGVYQDRNDYSISIKSGAITLFSLNLLADNQTQPLDPAPWGISAQWATPNRFLLENYTYDLTVGFVQNGADVDYTFIMARTDGGTPYIINGTLIGQSGATVDELSIGSSIGGGSDWGNGYIGFDNIGVVAINDTLISPESYAGFVDYGTQSIKSYTTAALSMPGYATGGSVRIPVSTASASKMPALSSLKQTTSVFAGYSHYGTATDSSINGADYDISSNGGIVGVRHEIDRFTIGGFLAVDEGKISSITLNADTDAYLLGAFASYLIKPEMNLIVTGGITYGDYEFGGTRQSLGLVTFDDVASEVFDIHLGIEGDAYSADKIRVTPFLGFHYITSDTDAFTETGLGALSVNAQSQDAFFSEIGIKTEYQLNQQLSLNGNLSYTNNLTGSDKNVGASLGGAPFAVSSPGLGDDFITIGIGAQYQVTEAIRLGINYRAEISSDSDVANGVNIGASYSF